MHFRHGLLPRIVASRFIALARHDPSIQDERVDAVAVTTGALGIGEAQRTTPAVERAGAGRLQPTCLCFGLTHEEVAAAVHPVATDNRRQRQHFLCCGAEATFTDDVSEASISRANHEALLVRRATSAVAIARVVAATFKTGRTDLALDTSLGRTARAHRLLSGTTEHGQNQRDRVPDGHGPTAS